MSNISKPEPLILDQRERVCLRCDEPFVSTNGQRICDPCTEHNKRVARRVDKSGSRHIGFKKTLGE